MHRHCMAKSIWTRLQGKKTMGEKVEIVHKISKVICQQSRKISLAKILYI